jgi:hypothetical protein
MEGGGGVDYNHEKTPAMLSVISTNNSISTTYLHHLTNTIIDTKKINIHRLNKVFFRYNVFIKRQEKYNADTSLQDWRQEKHMVGWT